jgi:hypothetical protein
MADKKKITEKTTARVGTKETPKIRFEDKIDEQIKAKGADAGTQYSHWTKNPHEVKASIVEVKVGSVYSADFKTIDDTIEAIKKESRKVCKNDYTANNVYVILQDALKKITLAYT